MTVTSNSGTLSSANYTALASASLFLVPSDYQPSTLVKMMPQHQMMPAADPELERLDETQVKTIQTKVNNKLDPAMPVRTRTPSRAVPCGPRAQHEPRRDSPTRTPLIT